MNIQNCNNNGCDRRRRISCLCSLKPICFLAALLTLALGLIFGAIYYETLLPILASIIIFAVAMAVAIIALLIYRACDGC